MRYHIYITVLLLLATTTNAYAQSEFRYPVKNENKLKDNLFGLKSHEYNHIFQVAMPGDNFLLIDFEKMSSYPDAQMLSTIFDIAATTAQQTKDSFASAITSKRVDVHVPVKNAPLQLRLKEHNDGTDMLVLTYDQQAPLKLGMDTIRVFKTMSVTTNKEEKEVRKEVQYTFILKDINDIAKLNDNKELIISIAHTLDSVVQYRRDKWKREDTWYHEVGIKYTPMETDAKKQLIVKKRAGLWKAIDADYYIGASLFRNSLTPYLEVGASYKWPGSVGEYDYIKLSLSTLAHFERISPSRYDFYNTAGYNFEIGTLINKSKTRIPIYETSIGIGYLQSDLPSISSQGGMRLFWNYSLSSAVRITPDVYVLFRKGQENIAFAGLTVSLKFL